MTKRILIGLAGTHYTPVAIQYAVDLAKSHNAELTGVTILDSNVIRVEGVGLGKAPGSEFIRDRRLQIAHSQIKEAVDSFSTACQTANIKYGIVEETGEAFTKLVDLVRYHDLMVFGLRSVFEYDYLAGSAESLLIRLIGNGVRPLIAVPEKHRQVSRVMIAYNGSMESAKAMKRFIQMRLWPRAHLRVVTFHPSHDEAYKLLHAAEGYCRAHGYYVESQSNPGQAKDLLLAAVTMWQADMIVMGNSARSIWMRRILGDTFLNVVSQTNVPLFLTQ